MSSRSDLFRSLLHEQVLVADGAMGTMLQAADPTLDDFDGHEGCNEVLNVTRPDIVRSVHEEYLAVGVDAIETNTFGANLANLGEYGISDRIHELAKAGAQVAREAADAWATERPPALRARVDGPGHQAAVARARRRSPRCATPTRSRPRACVAGGVDAVLIETSQDLLQAKAAVIGTRRALQDAGADVPVLVQVTVETTGTMLLGTEIARRPGRAGAAGHRRDRPELRHRAERDERAPAPPGPARPHPGHRACPTPACRSSSRDGAYYPLTPGRARRARTTQFTREFGLGARRRLLRHHARAPAPGGGRASAAVPVAPRRPRPEPGVASLYQHVPFRQDTAYLSIGERTNANGSKAFREAMLAERWDDCVEIARAQTRDGAHLLDVCVDYVGRDGVADMQAVVGRLATASTLPLVIDSTEPAVIEAGLELHRRPRGRQLGELRGRRRAGHAGSRASCRWCASTARPSSRSPSTSRARPARATTRSPSPAG